MSQLQFKTIKIANFKTFTGEHEFKLERTPGLYYITGANKLAPELGANGVGKSTIWDALTWVLWGRTGKDNRPADAIVPWHGKGAPSVELHFTRNGEEVHILRQRKPNRLMATSRRGLSSPEPMDITQDDVPGLLGMTEEMFRRTLVLHQSAMLFLDLKPEAQAQMFTEALDLDVWLRAVEVANTTAKTATRTAEQAAGDQQANERALATVATDIADFTAQAETFATDQASRIGKGERGIASLEKDLAAAEKDQPTKPALPDDTKLRALGDALQTAKQNVRDDEYDLKDIVKGREADQAKLTGLSKAKPKCESCGQALPSTKAETLVAELQASIRGYVKPENKAKATLEESQQALVDAQAAYDTERTAYDAAKANYQPLFTKYETAIKKVSAIKGELKVWRDNLVKVQGEANTALDQVARLKTRRASLRTEGTTLKELHETSLAEAESAKFWVDGFREIRLSIIDQTLLELEMATSRHAAMLGLNDWGIKFDTERETKAGAVSYGFSVLLYPPDKKEPVKWESYSGGESQRWQLAVAFALSEVLLARAGMMPNMEVLDEPTKGLSPVGVSDLLEHLRDRAQELGRAIYFVDHHSLDKGAFDGTLLVTKNKKGSSFAWQ